jgi:ABC-type transport system involved in cytochrome c biogenesis ATPase subunit
MAPFLVLQSLTSTFADPATPILIADIFSVFPPYAFQRALSSYLNLSDVFDDPDLTWAEVWSWENRVPYSLLLLWATGAASWLVVYWQTKPTPVRASTRMAAAEEPEHFNDPDVKEERERSMADGETGVKARSVAKHFSIPPDSVAYRIRYLNIFGYWLPRLFGHNPFAKLFTSKHAVTNVSFGIESNELFVLLGPNGAGKTSTIDMLVRNTLPDAGSVVLCGSDDRSGRAVFKPFKDGDVSYCPQFDSLFANVTVNEHFEFVVKLRGLDPKAESTLTHVAAIRELFDLDQHARKYSSSLSGGYKRKLSLALVSKHTLGCWLSARVCIEPPRRLVKFARSTPRPSTCMHACVLVSVCERERERECVFLNMRVCV